MLKARTVLGDITADGLGMVYSHEHLIISGGKEVEKNNALRLDSVEKACAEVAEIKARGIATMVDMLPVDCGREPLLLKQISEQTGINIIACTGFHKPMYYDDIHWFYRYDEDTIAKLFIEEIESGMDEYSYAGPVVKRMEAKAGVIKVASDYHNMKPVTQKLMRAAAQAQVMTGAPLVTHTEMGTYALEQISLLTRMGVDPKSVIICHLDRNPDIYYHKEVAATGVFIEYDGASRTKYWPDNVIANLIGDMVASGYGDQILLGTDFALKTYWKAYGGGPGLTYLVDRFIPLLKKAGINEKTVNAFMIENPARAFAVFN